MPNKSYTPVEMIARLVALSPADFLRVRRGRDLQDRAMARELLAGEDGPAGKRLDFLAQELMREANTIGSKVAEATQVQTVVGLKAEIERLREQVQNVE